VESFSTLPNTIFTFGVMKGVFQMKLSIKTPVTSNSTTPKTSFISKINFHKQEEFAGFTFILPAVVGLLVFVFYPMVNAFIISFKEFNLISINSSFIGIENYTKLLADRDFLMSLYHSFQFAIIVIPVQTAIALCMALLIQKKFIFTGLFRTIYFIPVIIAFGVASTVFKLIYNQDYGLLNSILKMFGLPTISFLSDPNTAMYGVIILCIWKAAGFFMIIFLAGLNNIPSNIYEAAEVDGANSVQRFFKITLPLLKRTMAFVVIITTIDAIKISTPIFILTNGGPADSTTTAVYYIYKEAFLRMNMGYASAAAFILFTIVLTISIIQMKFFKSDVEY
jgi:multiple sugar transport system permease protein